MVNVAKGGRTGKGLYEAKPTRGRKTAVVGVRMEIAMRDRVKLAAAHQGVSISEWIEWLIQSQLMRVRRKC